MKTNTSIDGQGLGAAAFPSAFELMQAFYLSDKYDPNAERRADTTQAAIAYVLGRLNVVLRERAEGCKAASVEPALADDDEASAAWLTRGETYAFTADQIERGVWP